MPPKSTGGGSFKLSLSAANNKKTGLGLGLKSSALSNPTAKKPRLALGDDVPDDDEGKKQEIQGWDAAEGGAVELGGKKKEGPRVIPALPNADWRGEAARRLAARTGRSQGGEGEKKVEGEVEEKKIQYGLHHFRKDENANGETVDTAPEPMEIDDGLTDAQRLEKNALDALINGKVDDKTVIPLHPNQTEDEAFAHALRTAPEEPSLEAYQATPIDGFGAALLRGMGWKDGQELNKKPIVKQKEIKRRPALLGIGAKEEAALGFELGGEWGGANKNKGRKPVERYNPVALKNKITGEIVTEDELKQRLEREKVLDDQLDEKSGKDKERRRDRDDEYSDRDRDRDRRREKDRRRDRSRARDDERYDSERRRDRKRSDRDRNDRDRSDRDRERRDRDRRYRSRSPDSEDRRERRRDRRDRSKDRRRDGSRDRDRDRVDEDRLKRRRRDYDDDERRDRR